MHLFIIGVYKAVINPSHVPLLGLTSKYIFDAWLC